MEQVKILKEVKDQMNRMEIKIDRVEGGLFGDPKYGSIGLVTRVANVEKKTFSKSAAIKWSLGSLVVIGSTIAGLLKYVIL